MRLVWETSVGSRVSGEGFTAQEKEIGELKADAEGRVDLAVRDSRRRRRPARTGAAQRR
jgi:hypothetical protein